MNILFYIDRYPGVGGIENVSTVIIKELCKEHTVFVISNIQQEGVECPKFINLLTMPDKEDELSHNNLVYLEEVIEEKQIECVVYQDSYGRTERNLCKALEGKNIPLYVFEHNSPLFIYNKRALEPITTPKGLLRRILHPYLLLRDVKRKRYLLGHANKYVLLSKQFIPEFCKLVGVDINDERITFINNPILPLEAADYAKKENIILCVSRLVKEKCVDKMIYMWKDLYPQLPEWRFIIVGDGPERQKLEQTLRVQNIPRVEFVGFTQPTHYYQKAKIFLITSKYEGWPMTLLEAMQHGCVSIAYHSFSSLTDIIDNGVNGYVIDANDYQTFEEKIIDLAHNEQLLHSLSSSAIRKSKVFGIGNIIGHWLKLLK